MLDTYSMEENIKQWLEEDKSIFDDKYFENLYSNIKERISNEKIYCQNLHISEIKLTKKEFKLKSLKNPKLFKKLFSEEKERESLYYKKLMDSKNITNIPLLFYNGSCEIITGITVPTLESIPTHLKSFKYNFENYVFKPDGEDKYSTAKCINTNLFCIQPDKIAEKYREYPEFELLINDNQSTRLATRDEIGEYIEHFCQKENYLKLLKFLFAYLSKVEYEEYYDVPPIIPKELVSYYKKIINQSTFKYIEKVTPTMLITPKLEEETDKSLISLDAIMELKQMIQKLDKDKQELYLNKLNDLIDKYKIISLGENKNYNLGSEFQQKLYELRAEIMMCEKKTINIELIERYFNYISNVSTSSFKEEEAIKKLEELFKFIRHFTSNKETLEFQKYLSIQELIFNILTNIVVFNPCIRKQVLNELSDIHKKGIQTNLNNLLNNSLGYLDENNPNTFAIYAIMLEEMDDIDFINKGLEIIDNLDKELITNLIKTKEKSDIKFKKR